MLRIQTNDHQRPFSSVALTTFMSIALVFVLILSMLLAPLTPNRNNSVGLKEAYAVSSAEKQAEADAAWERLIEFQAEIMLINIEYENAVAARMEAENHMLEAQAREEGAKERIETLQEQLSAVATQMYRRGSTSFLDVIFGATSFSDFITALDIANRLNAYNAKLIAESKAVHAEAEAARIEYAEQRAIALEKEEEIGELKARGDAKLDELMAEVAALDAEVARLVQEELAAAEAARQKQREYEAWLAAISGGYVDEYTAARVPTFIHPCPGYILISSYFGPRWGTNHNGIDFAAYNWTPILAAAAGTVAAVGWEASMGYYVAIDHGNGIRTTYMHAIEYPYVSTGSYVYQGQQIASVGSTGNSTGPHLHFQLNIDGVAVNPMQFLPY